MVDYNIHLVPVMQPQKMETTIVYCRNKDKGFVEYNKVNRVMYPERLQGWLKHIWVKKTTYFSNNLKCGDPYPTSQSRQPRVLASRESQETG